MSDTFKLNCWVVGDDPMHIFSVEIPGTKTIYALNVLIKEKIKPVFDDVDYLDIWKVDLRLPVDGTFEHNLKFLKLDPGQWLFSVVALSKVFFSSPERNHLHIVVQRTPPVSPNINVNCLVFGDGPQHVFLLEIARTETVNVLKDLISDNIRHTFRGVSADILNVWKVSLPIDDSLEHRLSSLNLDPKQPLSPAVRMFEMFPKLPEYKHLHIVIQRPDPSSVASQRLAYCYAFEDSNPPWYATQQAISTSKQGQIVYHPHEPKDPVPLTLLERIFAQFVDDCQNYQPTDEDNRFVRELSEKMCLFYPDKYSGMDVFKEVLDSYGISSQCATDEQVSGKIAAVIMKGEGDFRGSNTDYYRKFIESLNDAEQLQSIFPLFHIMVFASRELGTCIGIGGTVFTSNFQTNMLVPIIPLFWHPTDLLMHAMAARTFGALKIAAKALEDLYSTPIPPLTSVDSSLDCPYPRRYIDASGIRRAFSYEKVQNLVHQLIFYGTTENGVRICIKFVKKYSPEAHRFCALHGHAPELLAYERLPGGWGMVVMDALEIRCDEDDAFWPRTERSYQRFSQMSVQDLQALEKAVNDFIHELHAHGYVHGDLRDVNLFARSGRDTMATSDFTILDFEWAGRIDSDETCYPMYINREDIRRPLGAQDGMKIEVEHDLEMLRYLFHPYEDEACNDDGDV